MPKSRTPTTPKCKRLSLEEKKRVLQLSGEKVQHRKYRENWLQFAFHLAFLIPNLFKVSHRCIGDEFGISLSSSSKIVRKKESVLKAADSFANVKDRKLYRLKFSEIDNTFFKWFELWFLKVSKKTTDWF